jgi:hypothetical protein
MVHVGGSLHQVAGGSPEAKKDEGPTFNIQHPTLNAV